MISGGPLPSQEAFGSDPGCETMRNQCQNWHVSLTAICSIEHANHGFLREVHRLSSVTNKGHIEKRYDHDHSPNYPLVN